MHRTAFPVDVPRAVVSEPRADTSKVLNCDASDVVATGPSWWSRVAKCRGEVGFGSLAVAGVGRGDGAGPLRLPARALRSIAVYRRLHSPLDRSGQPRHFRSTHHRSSLGVFSRTRILPATRPPRAGSVFETIGHHRPDGGDAVLSQQSRKPAAHGGGYGFVQMLYEPRPPLN
jgi:hypothetical protein